MTPNLAGTIVTIVKEQRPGGFVRASQRPALHALAILAALLASTALPAQISNGSFETQLTGWTLGGGAQVEALQAANFTPQITAPDGNWFALISTGPGDTGGPTGDFDGNGTTDYDRSTLSNTFTTTVAGENLSFRWAFLTDEIGPNGQGDPLYDDLFDITISGVSIVRGSVRKAGGGSSPFADTVGYDDVNYTVNSTGATDSSAFGTSPGGGRTPFQQVCLAITDPGSYTLEFLLADQGDAGLDTGLLVDDIEIGSGCDPMMQLTASDLTQLEVKDGTFVFGATTNDRAAVSSDGMTLAFASNGNYSSDNPNLQEQIWVATRNGTTYEVTRITAAVGADFGNPDISHGGNWLVFASTGDLVFPGNPEGNSEIFLYDRSLGTLSQITSTTGCTNAEPTVGDNGDRIAFVSDCDFGFSVSGDEIVLWDGGFSGIDTTGCVNRTPRISRDGAARYVSFVTDCSGQYPATGNADGSLEILQWDAQTGTYIEVTDSPAGSLVDGLATSEDGGYISYVSTADHETGMNPFGDAVVFRYDRAAGAAAQLVGADPLALFTVTAIDGSGTFVAAERIDLLGGSFDIVLLDTTVPGAVFPVATGSPTVANLSPSVGVEFNRPLVTFLSNGDFSGNNADGNVEIWTGGASFVLPAVSTFCRTPNLPIPDQNGGGVTDTMTVTTAGTLTDLNVYVRIEHTWVGDLVVRIRHVDDGVTRRIVDRPGRPPGSGCSGDDIDATLDDEGTAPVENQCDTVGPIAIEGTFLPNQTLSNFDGLALATDWELRVSDRAGGDIGTLLEWCLIPSTL